MIQKKTFLSFLVFLSEQIWRYRTLIWALSVRELKSRYKGSSLGFLWTFANPLLMITIYSVVFKGTLRVAVENYPLFVFNGILLWNTFAAIMHEGTLAFTLNASLITRSAVAPEVLVMRVIVANYCNYFLSLPLCFVFLFVFHVPVCWPMLQILWLVPLGILFISAVGLLLSVLGAFYKDVRNLMRSLVFALFFTVPVMYPLSLLPPKAALLLHWSPFTQLIAMQSEAMFFGRWITASDYIALFIGGSAVFLVSLFVFYKMRNFVAERV